MNENMHETLWNSLSTCEKAKGTVFGYSHPETKITPQKPLSGTGFWQSCRGSVSFFVLPSFQNTVCSDFGERKTKDNTMLSVQKTSKINIKLVKYSTCKFLDDLRPLVFFIFFLPRST